MIINDALCYNVLHISLWPFTDVVRMKKKHKKRLWCVKTIIELYFTHGRLKRQFIHTRYYHIEIIRYYSDN